ncbi:cupredoxin family copper-binding protein [Methanolobus sp. ZRKC2]|uniref:cupredoxin domain-containing protein n=1 Tax=Methanolobus sp. ZRKC2 TaxID=3125783 RepID=UPI003243AF7A
MRKLLKWLLIMVLVAAAVLASGCTDYGTTDSSNDNGGQVQTNEVAIEDSEFLPQSIRVSAGESVTWINDGSETHTVTADNGAFDSGHLEQGEVYTQVFEEPGTYNYRCTIHPEVVGTVTVE